MQRYITSQPLTNTEKTYFYSTIKKKIEALQVLKEEWHIKGNNMIPERVEAAKHILKELHKEKAFISGSFLYAKQYNDIDIFIVGKRRKQYREEKKDFIYITKEDLKKPQIYSTLQYSIANFTPEEITPIIKRPEVDGILFSYQLAINEILDNDDQKTIREIIFVYYMLTKAQVLNSYETYLIFKEIKNKSVKEKIEYVNEMIRNILLQSFSKRYMYEEMISFKKGIENIKEEYKRAKNLPIYIEWATEVKNECRRAQT
ncbi:MAG: hypothetical protein AABX82_00970 [Nanoarchaeota archaeon]